MILNDFPGPEEAPIVPLDTCPPDPSDFPYSMQSAVQPRTGVIVCLVLLSTSLFAQAPSPNSPAVAGQSSDQTAAPMTPEEQREKDIQAVDPVYRKEKAEKEKAAREAAKRLDQDRQNASASIATDNQPSSGPAVLDPDTVAQYNGPSVLSRSYSVNQSIMPKDLHWRESIGAGSSYDTGLGEVAANGTSQGGTLQGTQVSWGLSGGHAFGNRDQIGITYSGGMSYYPGSSLYTGANQTLGMTLSHVISKRLQLGVNVVGSDLPANAALQNQAPAFGTIANVNLATSPGIAVVDTGSKQYTAGANLGWQLTGRLSFSFSGSSFGVERNSPALYGVTGRQAASQGTYRLTRKMTVGGSYSYSQYVYPHGAGVSDSHSAGVIFSYALDRSTQISFNGGLSRVESLDLQTVTLSPVIAALLGQATGVIDAYQTFRSTDISAKLSRSFRKYGSASFSYARGVTPGNGLFQTSEQESMALGASRKVLRDYALGIGAGRTKLISITQSLGAYASDYASVTLGRSYKKGVGVNFSVSYRHFDIAGLSSLKNQLSISSGFSWSSSRLWPF